MPDNNERIMTRPTIGVGVLIWRDRQLLLGKRISKGQPVCWQFPGGHLEQGESVTGCASREVSEETGLQVKALRHFGFTDRTFVVGDSQYITLLVSCDFVEGEAQVLEPDKCECWQWFDYRQLPQPLFEPIQIFLTQRDDLYKRHKAALESSNIGQQ